MVKKQAEAMRLADLLEQLADEGYNWKLLDLSADELRRLHAENEELKGQRDELLDALYQYLVHASEPECAIWRHIQQKARTAIAKATGE